MTEVNGVYPSQLRHSREESGYVGMRGSEAEGIEASSSSSPPPLSSAAVSCRPLSDASSCDTDTIRFRDQRRRVSPGSSECFTVTCQVTIARPCLIFFFSFLSSLRVVRNETSCQESVRREGREIEIFSITRPCATHAQVYLRPRVENLAGPSPLRKKKLTFIRVYHHPFPLTTSLFFLYDVR